MQGKYNNMETEVKNAVKVLKDFGIKVSEETQEEWKTWSSIKLGNHVKMLIKRKLGG